MHRRVVGVSDHRAGRARNCGHAVARGGELVFATIGIPNGIEAVAYGSRVARLNSILLVCCSTVGGSNQESDDARQLAADDAKRLGIFMVRVSRSKEHRDDAGAQEEDAWMPSP